MTAITVRASASTGWDALAERTAAADVRISSFEPLDAARLAAVPGVRAVAPMEIRTTEMHHRGRRVEMAATPMPEGAIDRLLVVDGRPTDTGVVLERSFAAAIGAEVGDAVSVPTTDGRLDLQVDAVAASARTPGYPATSPGTGFVARDLFARVAAAGPVIHSVGLRVAPGQEDVVVGQALAAAGGRAVAQTARSLRADVLDDARPLQVVLGSFSVILLVVASVLVAIVLGARLRTDRRRLEQLRVAGLTPAQVVGLVVADHALIGVVGAAVGAGAGVVATPRVAGAVATAVHGVPVRLDLASVATCVALVTVSLMAVAAGAAVAALRRRRAAVAPVRMPSRLLAAGAGPTLVVAAKDALARRGRAGAAVAAVASAVMSASAALHMEATLDRAPSTESDAALRTIVYGLDALLIAAAASTVVATAIVSRRERRRDIAVLAAVGFSTRQLIGASVLGQSMLAAAAGVVGLPFGFLFFRAAYAVANGASSEVASASVVSQLALVPVAVVLAAAVALIPAATRRREPVVSALAVTS